MHLLKCITLITAKRDDYCKEVFFSLLCSTQKPNKQKITSELTMFVKPTQLWRKQITTDQKLGNLPEVLLCIAKAPLNEPNKKHTHAHAT